MKKLLALIMLASFAQTAVAVSLPTDPVSHFMARQLEGIKNQYNLVFTSSRSGDVSPELSIFFKSQADALLKNAIGTCLAISNKKQTLCLKQLDQTINQIKKDVLDNKLDAEAGQAMITAIQTLK